MDAQTLTAAAPSSAAIAPTLHLEIRAMLMVLLTSTSEERAARKDLLPNLMFCRMSTAKFQQGKLAQAMHLRPGAWVGQEKLQLSTYLFCHGCNRVSW